MHAGFAFPNGIFDYMGWLMLLRLMLLSWQWKVTVMLDM